MTIENKHSEPKKGTWGYTNGGELHINSTIVTKENITFSPTLKQIHWNPEDDITTSELAQCLPLLIGMGIRGAEFKMWEDQLFDLPENCKRHFMVQF